MAIGPASSLPYKSILQNPTLSVLTKEVSYSIFYFWGEHLEVMKTWKSRDFFEKKKEEMFT